MADNYKNVFQGFQKFLSDEPAQALTSFSVSTRQVAGLRSQASLRDFTLDLDEPPALAGTDAGPSPVELILAALGSCQEITYRLYADALGIPLNGVSVALDGELDLRGFFAVDQSARPGFRGIRATVTLDSPADDERLAELKAIVDRHCPVLDILRNPTPVRLALARARPATVAAA